jgi:hypothetical protein
MIHGDSPSNAIRWGLTSMFAMAIIGAVVGMTADWLVQQTTESAFRGQLKRFQEEIEKLNAEAAARQASGGEKGHGGSDGDNDRVGRRNPTGLASVSRRAG